VRTETRIEEQRRFWNAWNVRHRVQDRTLPQVNARQARRVLGWMSSLGRIDLDILEIGCGSGWLCEQLVAFGQVTGTDLAHEALPASKAGQKTASFIAGDFFELEFPRSGFDVVVSLEVLSHVENQAAFLERIAQLLRPGGHLMLATQNRFALERCSAVAPKGAGQIRNWVDAKTLKRLLLGAHFEIAELTSVFPVGDRGILRWVNAYKLNRVLSAIASQARLDALKEHLLLGHTLMVLARKHGVAR
jgi:2-polyprenyl-3-methyl-5-hydroxy-6-metoxy-1,4-benzoquinol methylase